MDPFESKPAVVRSYCRFEILIKTVGAESLLGMAIKDSENEKAMKDGREQRRNGPPNRSLLALAGFPAEPRVYLLLLIRIADGIDGALQACHISHAATCLSFTDCGVLKCNIKLVSVSFILAEKGHLF